MAQLNITLKRVKRHLAELPEKSEKAWTQRCNHNYL